MDDNSNRGKLSGKKSGKKNNQLDLVSINRLPIEIDEAVSLKSDLTTKNRKKNDFIQDLEAFKIRL